MTTRDYRISFAALAAAAFFFVSPMVAQAQGVTVGASDLGGVVTGAGGPEAGVWVIAETTDLPTKFAKVVVTDDQGRYLIPELPKAKYKVWVRGYGLVDSAKVDSEPGRTLDLKAVPAPNEKAAAEYYPGMYWYAMINVPGTSEFPGTGDKGNGIPDVMKSQHYWLDTVKNSCQSCHALGSKGMREIPEFFKKQSKDSVEAWARRTQAGQAMNNMALGLGRIGPDRAFKIFADWTDRIEKGETPAAKPPRPQGLERNVVITMWDWASPKQYQHDAISTDKRKPTVNANGKIWGSPEESTDLVPWLDPVTHTAGTVKHPFRAKPPSSSDLPRGPSAYWGEEAIWDGHTSIHNPIIDERGRVWFSARIRPHANPDYCKQGSDHPSAKVAPLNESPRHLSMYDPKSEKWTLISTCFATHHLYFAPDKNNTLWFAQGGPQSGVVGWFDVAKFEETGDEAKSQGWTPLIIDTNGNGKRDEFVAANQPLDPTKDKRVMAAFYGVQPSPVDGSIWGQSMDTGFSRIDQPGYVMRIDPGADPANTALTEVYLPPEGTWGVRGIDLTSDGVVWVALASGHMASLDRRKCTTPLNGPNAATGKICPEGWTVLRMPGPQFKNVDEKGSANGAYYLWVDRFNTLGLGKDVPIAQASGGESLLAVVDGKMVDIRVPYPLGFFTKNVDGRIDDPNAGWKGKALWTTLGTRTVFHNEGGTENRPKVYKVQVRPDPLAR